jgi:hypothetical protein
VCVGLCPKKRESGVEKLKSEVELEIKERSVCWAPAPTREKAKFGKLKRVNYVVLNPNKRANEARERVVGIKG